MSNIKLAIIITLIFFINISLGYSKDIDIDNEINNLKSQKTEIKLSAVANLSKDGSEESINVLANHLKEETNPYIRIQIIESLTEHQSRYTMQALISMLDDSNPAVRQSAIISLGYFGDVDNIVAEVSDALDKEKDVDIKLSALNTLSLSKNKKAVNAISKQIKSTNSIVKISCVIALDKIATKEAISVLKSNENIKDIKIRNRIKDALKRHQKIRR